MDMLLMVNKALMKCGLPLATSLGQYDWNAQMIFEERALDALRSFQWSFAERFVSIQPGGEPAHGYRHSYPCPSDCLRVCGVYSKAQGQGPRVAFSKVGKQIYANEPVCHLRYIAKVLDPADWPPDFAEAVACAMAAEIATLSAETMSLAPSLYQLYQTKLTACQLADSTEHGLKLDINREFWLARMVDTPMFLGRDNTYRDWRRE